MNHFIKIILLASLLFVFNGICKGQSVRLTSEVLKDIGANWKKDSLSCKGYRRSVARYVLKSKVDHLDKSILISTLGKPNKIQKFYSGNTNKNYVGYIYYIYKDQCPKIDFEGSAIQFVLDESETYLVEVTEIDYCG